MPKATPTHAPDYTVGCTLCVCELPQNYLGDPKEFVIYSGEYPTT